MRIANRIAARQGPPPDHSFNYDAYQSQLDAGTLPGEFVPQSVEQQVTSSPGMTINFGSKKELQDHLKLYGRTAGTTYLVNGK